MDIALGVFRWLNRKIYLYEFFGEIGYLLVEYFVVRPIHDEFLIDGEVFDDLQLVLTIQVIIDSLPVLDLVILLIVNKDID
jgi:hypothetical protein